MRYMTMIKSAVAAGPPPPELMAAIGALTVEGFRDGYLMDAGGLAPARFVQVRAGKVDVTDGPFTEAAEVVGGYSVFECRTLDEAIELGVRMMQAHADHWPGWEGELAVHQIFGPESSGG